MVDDLAGTLPLHYVHSIEWDAWDPKVRLRHSLASGLLTTRSLKGLRIIKRPI